MFAGDFAEAEARFRDSLALSRRYGYAYGEAFTLLGVGLLATFRADYQGARRAYEESLRLHANLGDAWGASAVRNNLAWVDLEEGLHDRAAALFREGPRRYQELGDRAQIADTLDGLAAAAMESGQDERAARLWGAIEDVRARIAAPRWQLDAAAQERRAALALSRAGEDRFERAYREGRAMTLDEAMAYALDETESASA